MDVGSDLEDKDIWKVYLEMEDYTNALQACQTSAEKDLVLTRHAEDAISKGENTMAAKIFAKVFQQNLVLILCGKAKSKTEA